MAGVGAVSWTCDKWKGAVGYEHIDEIACSLTIWVSNKTDIVITS